MSEVLVPLERQPTGDGNEAHRACAEAALQAHINDPESCEEGERGCAFCPWRNPFKIPATGDRFMLANGREIAVTMVNHRHTISTEVEYEFTRWKKSQGGRASYRLWLKNWGRVVAGAQLLRIGPKPQGIDKPSYPERLRTPAHVVAMFERRNTAEVIDGLNLAARTPETVTRC